MNALDLRHNELGSIGITGRHGQYTPVLITLQNSNGDVELIMELPIECGSRLNISAVPIEDAPSTAPCNPNAASRGTTSY